MRYVVMDREEGGVGIAYSTLRERERRYQCQQLTGTLPMLSFPLPTVLRL